MLRHKFRRLRKTTASFWSVLILTLLFIGCSTSKEARQTDQNGIGPVKEGLPLEVAVLPFENLTADEEIASELRAIFAAHFSGKPFLDKEIALVDDVLERNGITTIEKIKDKSPQVLGTLLNVDGLIYGKVTGYKDYGRAMVVRVTAEIELIDARTGERIAKVGPLSQSSYDLDLPTSPYSAAWILIKGIIRKPQARRVAVLHSLSALLVEALPEPARKRLIKPPQIYALAHDFSYLGNKARTPRKAGEVIKVVLVGEKGCEAYFTIEGLTDKVPMREEPTEANYSNYKGQYLIKAGDDREKAMVKAFLVNKQGIKAQFKDTSGFISIDTTPPKSPQGLKALGRDRLVLLSWKANSEKDLKGYRIYRQGPKGQQYHLLKEVYRDEFDDGELENFHTYHYRITAFDEAGNESVPSEVVTVIPKGLPPTVVSTDIIRDVIWYEEASPYILKGDIRILKQATLSIQPGVVVKSAGGSLRVMGQLIARGDREKEIVFTSSKEESPAIGDWQGIVFDHTRKPQSIIEYCRIQYARTAIDAISSSAIIRKSIISRNLGGIRCSDFSRLIIEYSHIERNQEFGIKVEKESAPIIKFNKISHNSTYGVWSDQPLTHFSLNEISGNGEYELYYRNNEGLVFDARNNYWGTVDYNKLRLKIFGKVRLSSPEKGSEKSSPTRHPKLESTCKGFKKDTDRGKMGEKPAGDNKEEKEREADVWESLRKTLGND